MPSASYARELARFCLAFSFVFGAACSAVDGDGNGDGGGRDADLSVRDAAVEPEEDAGPEQLHTPTSVDNARAGDDWVAASDAARRTLAGLYNPQTGMFNSGHMWTWA